MSRDGRLHGFLLSQGAVHLSDEKAHKCAPDPALSRDTPEAGVAAKYLGIMTTKARNRATSGNSGFYPS